MEARCELPDKVGMGEDMKKIKIITGGLLVLFASAFSFAGDAAVLVDNGFSEDGAYYIFGQYGKTDKSFQGWAEIYTVDVAKNEYVDGGVFRIKPSVVTADKTGREVYDSLAGRSYDSVRKYKCSPAKPDQILYIREDEQKSPVEEIIFKDFIRSLSNDRAHYSVRLVPEFFGSGSNIKSSFVINLEKRDSDGTVLARQTIGSPSIRRSGVTGYKIERIVCDAAGKNIVFIVEKTVEDKTGTNIRYMVEAASLNGDFFRNLAENRPDTTGYSYDDSDAK